MNQYKKLFNNSLVFAVGNLGSKLITFLMLPLYTYALTTSEYGEVDLLLTTTSLLLPIVGLSIFDSVLRFSMDKENDHQVVFSNGIYVTKISSLILILVIPIIIWFKIQLVFLPVLLIIQLFQNLFSQYAKSINKLNVFAMNGILLSFTTAGLNIFFLIPLNMGLPGYLLSLLLANLVSTLYLAIRLNVFEIYNKKYVNKEEIVRQLKFSLPLIPNSIAWWFTTAVGRYFVLLWIGASANGIFAVSNKIPTLLTVFTSIFAQSWQISAIEGYEEKSNKEMLSTVYNYYFFLLFTGSSILILFIKPIMRILVSIEFFDAWEYVPVLLLSVVFSSVSGFLGSQYIAMKDTIGVFKTTIIGALTNILANICFIPVFGLQGVGLSSLISFFVVWLIRHIQINKTDKLHLVMNHFFYSLMLLMVQTIAALYLGNSIGIATQIVIVCLIFLVNKKNTFIILRIVRNEIYKKGRKSK